MSLEGVIARRGASCRIHRPADARQPDGSTARTWPVVSADTRLLLEELEDSLLRRVFGQETTATARAIASLRSDVRLDDGVVVLTGPYTGRMFVVVSAPQHPASGSGHRELALALTAEPIVAPEAP